MWEDNLNFLLEEALLWIMDSYFGQKCQFKDLFLFTEKKQYSFALKLLLNFTITYQGR